MFESWTRYLSYFPNYQKFTNLTNLQKRQSLKTAEVTFSIDQPKEVAKKCETPNPPWNSAPIAGENCVKSRPPCQIVIFFPLCRFSHLAFICCQRFSGSWVWGMNAFGRHRLVYFFPRLKSRACYHRPDRFPTRHLPGAGASVYLMGESRVPAKMFERQWDIGNF